MLHCPSCHGYEVRNQPLGVIANGELAFVYVRLIHQWSPKLTLFTNGPSTLDEAESEKLKEKGIRIIEKEIIALEHENGWLSSIVFHDQSRESPKAVFYKAGVHLPLDFHTLLGCEINPAGLVHVDGFQKTSVPDVFAAGDVSTGMRSVAEAVATGNKAGAVINKELVEEDF